MRLVKSNESKPYDEASKSLTDVKKGLYSRPLMSVEDTYLLTTRHPVLRRRERKLGQFRERENLHSARNGV